MWHSQPLPCFLFQRNLEVTPGKEDRAHKGLAGPDLQRSFLSQTAPFGRYTDKHSYAKGISLGLTVVGISFLINIFTSPEYWWLIIPYTLLFNIAMAGIGQNLHNIIYNFVDEKLFVQASAIKNSIGGICGFVASFLGGMLVKVVQGNASAGTTAMTVFGMEVYAQQMLSLISFVGVVGAIIFTRIVLEKQKTIAK